MPLMMRMVMVMMTAHNLLKKQSGEGEPQGERGKPKQIRGGRLGGNVHHRKKIGGGR